MSAGAGLGASTPASTAIATAPIAYPSSLVPDAWRWAYAINPMATVVDGFRWALLAGTARAWFVRSPRRLAVVRRTGGAMLVGLGGINGFNPAAGTRS